MDYIIGLRSYQVERGKIEPTMRDALESILKHGNPWGRPREKRTQWIDDETDVRILAEGEETDVLLYVGCTPAYDPEIQKSTRALAKILNDADVDFAIIGNDESCCGNEVKRMGELGLFEMLVEENTALFKKYKFNTMITISPHCYNTFKNEYALDFEILHYTQFLKKLLDEGKLQISASIEKKVVFHDPCFLGKQNDEYDAPRELLKYLLTDEDNLLEFGRNRERSLCCEGGGGRMWLEVESESPRNAEIRIDDAKSIGAEVVATSCPFCQLTLNDAVKTTKSEDKIRVMDICSLIAENKFEETEMEE